MKPPIILIVVAAATCLINKASGQGLPIAPARTISFNTEEASYMNVDISPDGQTLVFDLLGDLYTMPVSGGEAKQLSRGIALHLRPVWSPDGKAIACISDISGSFHPYVINLKSGIDTLLGSSDKPLYYGTDLLWSPDKKQIAANESIYSFAEVKKSSRNEYRGLIGFSRDGKFAYGIDSNTLFRIEREHNIKTGICPIPGGNYGCKLSPSGRWFCYIADSNGRRCLMVKDLDKNDLRLIVADLDGMNVGGGPGIPFRHYCFSSDSKSIFISYGGKIHQIDVQNGDDRVVPFKAKVKVDLGSFDYHQFRVLHDSVRVRYARNGDYSPDGRKLVFSALDRIYIMDAKSGKAHVLAPQGVGQFESSFSPDGRWIAYVSWCDTVGGFLWIVPLSGGQPKQLTAISGQYQRPAWTPDGKQVAVICGAPRLGDRDDPGSGSLELVPIDGGPIRVIADSVPLWNSIGFSVDGRKIIYIPKHPRVHSYSVIPQLISQDLANGQEQILAYGLEHSFYQQKVLSPDGRYLVYAEGEDLYLVPIRNSGDSLILSDNNRELNVIRFASGVDPCWKQDGKLLTWTYGNHIYRIAADKILIAARREKMKREPKTFAASYLQTVAVTPDESKPLTVKAPSFYAHGKLAITHVRIITMKGDEVIGSGTIVIDNGRITAVGPVNAVPIPALAKVLDMEGATIMPGLIDVHLHMRVPSNIFPQQSWMFLINLAYGVTTARDPSASFDSFGYSELLRTGQMLGPRLFTVGRAVRIGDGVVQLNSPDDAKRVVQQRMELGATVVKNYLQPIPRLQRQWVLMACRAAGLNMTNEGWSDPILQWGMVKDGSSGLEHNPILGNVYGDVITFIAHSGIFFTPTLQVSQNGEMGKEYFKYKYWRQPNEKLRRFSYSDPAGRSTRNGAESLEEIEHSTCRDTVSPSFLSVARVDARILHAGGRICLGSHGNDEGIGPHNELWALQMGGFSNMEALQAATIRGAEALGVQHDLGSLEVGKIADMIILNRNPLEDIHNSTDIRYVMKDGILYDANTMDIVWPFIRKCPEWRLVKVKD